MNKQIAEVMGYTLTCLHCRYWNKEHNDSCRDPDMVWLHPDHITAFYSDSWDGAGRVINWMESKGFTMRIEMSKEGGLFWRRIRFHNGSGIRINDQGLIPSNITLAALQALDED